MRKCVFGVQVQQGFIDADKEILFLSSRIYVVDCITFSEARQLHGSLLVRR